MKSKVHDLKATHSNLAMMMKITDHNPIISKTLSLTCPSFKKSKLNPSLALIHIKGYQISWHREKNGKVNILFRRGIRISRMRISESINQL